MISPNNHQHFINKLFGLVKNHYGLILILVAYFSLLSYKVIAHPTPFFDWDESIYAQIGKEMVQHKTLIPLWQGEAWLEKPPLAPLFYGFIIQYVPGNPEITTRIASILLALVALSFVYIWVLKVTKNRLFSLAVTILTSLNPIFIQRSQIVNTDVFLLIGWLGYFFFYTRFWLGLLFLAIGFFSKSLLGLYPAFLMIAFEVYIYFKKQDTKILITRLKNIFIQIGILCIWYIVMIILFPHTFIKVHFADHLLKRVTKSIESHFGQRTYYLDIVYSEYGIFSLIGVVSFFILTWQWLKKKIDDLTYFLSLCLVPWFIFLNVTKTKIAWYIYPSIPVFTFLILYPLTLLKKYKIAMYILISFVVIGYIFVNFKDTYNTTYSSYDENYKLSVYARTQCSSLSILVSPNDRKTHDVLSDLNDLISTSDIYGSHPAMMYYFGKKIYPFYNVASFTQKLNSLKTGECATMDSKDLPPDMNRFKQIGIFDSNYLFKRV